MASSSLLVVDSSVFIALVVKETAERRRYAEGVVRLANSGRVRMVIPQLCRLEVAAVVTRRMRRGEIKADQVRDFLERFDMMALDLVVESFDALALHERAVALGCQVADAVYVDLALGMGAALATLDDGMAQACAAVKVPVRAIATA